VAKRTQPTAETRNVFQFLTVYIMRSKGIRLEEEGKVKSREDLRFEVCDCNCVGHEECCLMVCGTSQCGGGRSTLQSELLPAFSVYIEILLCLLRQNVTPKHR